MKSRLALAAVAGVLACRSGGTLADAPVADVRFSSDTPVVDVPAHRPGRQFLELPALEYTFDVEARCDDDWEPESLSLSVADSRVVVGAGGLSAAEPPRVVLKVPARQLAPIAVHGFCLLEDGDAEAADTAPGAPSVSLTIRAVLSAQASLKCRHGNAGERRITYVSEPLDVQLACKPRAPLATGD